MPNDITTAPKPISGPASGPAPGSSTKPMAQAAAAMGAEISTRGSAASERFQELSQFYRSMLTRNTERMTASVARLSGVKNPGEFMEVQQSLFKESMEASFADYQRLAQLNAAIFTAALQPMQIRT